MDTNEAIKELIKKLSDEGKLIESGWMAMRLAAIEPNAPEIQVREMRMAFMAGAQHLFTSIMGILEPGAEPTEADLRRLDLIDKELRAFVKYEMEPRAEAFRANVRANQ